MDFWTGHTREWRVRFPVRVDRIPYGVKTLDPVSQRLCVASK